MSNPDNDELKKQAASPEDRMTIKTGSSTYTFTQSWVENDALKDILVGLVADDFNKL